MSGMFRINFRDIGKGLVTAVFSSVVVVLYSVTVKEGFNLFTADWAVIGEQALSAGFVALVGYLGKNAITDSSGKVGGVL